MGQLERKDEARRAARKGQKAVDVRLEAAKLASPQLADRHIGELLHSDICGYQLTRLVSDELGQLRISGQDSGGSHLVWQWIRGRYAGTYVYWYVPRYGNLGEGLCGLADKRDEVYEGVRTPTKVSRPE